MELGVADWTDERFQSGTEVLENMLYNSHHYKTITVVDVDRKQKQVFTGDPVLPCEQQILRRMASIGLSHKCTLI